MNYMKQVAEMLGVELNEEFDVCESCLDWKKQLVKCKITESGLLVYSNHEKNWFCDHLMLGQILSKDDSIEIKKPPFVPKKNDIYWTVASKKFNAKRETWDDYAIDYARLKCGMVFRTENEAVDARPRIYEELTGKKWSDQP